MIGRSSGIRVTISFGHFAMCPPKALDGLRRMILHAMDTYGLTGAVETDGDEDAHQRWHAYVAAEMLKETSNE